MSSPPSSLRDLYAPPSTSWAFLPPIGPDSNASTFQPGTSAPQSYQWSTRTRENTLFDFSSSFQNNDGSFNLFVTAKLKGFLAAAFLQYATTAIIMPLDVGKMLLQVQWVPRDAGEVVSGAVLTTDAVDDDAEVRLRSAIRSWLGFIDP